MTSIDWPIVAASVVFFVVLYHALKIAVWYARKQQAKAIAQQAKDREAAFYAGISDKYKPTMSKEEVAFYNGPAWR